MAQSQNTKVEYTVKASFMNGLTSTGTVIVGDKAFEYYNDRNVEDFVQIPWEEIDYVSAEVIGKRHIARFAIFTKRNGHYTFSTKDDRATLRAVREHVPADRLLRSLSFFQVVGRGLMYLPHLISDKIHGRDAGAKGKDAGSGSGKGGKGGEGSGKGASSKHGSAAAAKKASGAKKSAPEGPGVTRNRHFGRKR